MVAMTNFKLDFLESYDNQAILAELRRIASVTGKDSVTKADIHALGRLSYELVNKRFGTLRKALEEAQLTPHRYMNATDTELIHMLIDLWEQTLEKEGRTPQRKDLKRFAFPVSGDTYIRRFGTWNKALKRAYDSVQSLSTEEAKTPDTPPPTTNKPQMTNALSLRKRFFVMKRDSFSCVRCGRSGLGVRLEVDHRNPRAKGGSDNIDNLQTLCFECNRGKRDSSE